MVAPVESNNLFLFSVSREANTQATRNTNNANIQRYLYSTKGQEQEQRNPNYHPSITTTAYGAEVTALHVARVGSCHHASCCFFARHPTLPAPLPLQHRAACGRWGWPRVAAAAAKLTSCVVPQLPAWGGPWGCRAAPRSFAVHATCLLRCLRPVELASRPGWRPKCSCFQAS